MQSSISLPKSKLPDVGTTIFTVMSNLAHQHNAINLSQGFPGFPIDPRLTTLVNEAMLAGHNQYAPMAGVPSLREAIANKLHGMYGCEYSPEDEITITSGGTQALYTAIAALLGEGDEVVIFTPAYDSYTPAVKLHGASPIYVQLQAPNYTIPWDEVKKLVSRKTKMIIINSPHNPTGTLLSRNDLFELEKIVSGSDVVILSDEVYEHIVMDGERHVSCCEIEGLRERTIAVFSFGKTLHATGWKLGYAVAPKELMHEFRKVHQFNVFSANNPMQHAIAKYISDESTYSNLGSFFQEKRDFFLERLKGSRFEWIPTKGTYFQLLNYGGISQDSDVEIAKEWTEKHKVASIPISVFYHAKLDQKMLRFCFAKENEELERAADILRQI